MVKGVFDGVTFVYQAVFKYGKVDLFHGVSVKGDCSEGVMCTISSDVCGDIAASLNAVLRDNYPS